MELYTTHSLQIFVAGNKKQREMQEKDSSKFLQILFWNKPRYNGRNRRK